MRGFNKFDNRGFESLYTLNDDVTTERLEKIIINSAIILISLANCTKLFGVDFKINNVNDLLNNEKALFLGSLILKLYKICDKNSIAIPVDARYSLSHDENRQRGQCIIPIGSLINHSCDPNVEWCIIQSKRLKFIFYSRMAIRKNSQVKNLNFIQFIN